MLTILHRQPNGAETIFQAKRIERLQPSGEQCVPAIGNRFRVWLDEGDEVIGEITIEQPFGAVFVMNKNGSTVARYLARDCAPTRTE
jgi:hypothetical protein